MKSSKSSKQKEQQSSIQTLWPFLSSNWIATSVREERSQATMAITDAAFVNILTWIITNKEQAASLLLSTVYCTLHTRQQPSDPLLSVVFWLTAELNPRTKLTLNSLHLFVHILSRIRLLTVQQLCRISQRDIAAIPRVQHDISANNLPQSRHCQIFQCWPCYLQRWRTTVNALQYRSTWCVSFVWCLDLIWIRSSRIQFSRNRQQPNSPRNAGEHLHWWDTKRRLGAFEGSMNVW